MKKYVKLYEEFITENKFKLDPILKDAYNKMKVAFKDTKVDVYTAEENNAIVNSGVWPEENRLEEMEDILLIADRPEVEDSESGDTLDGAYNVFITEPDSKTRVVVADWMPYPEEEIVGVDNIIKTVLNQIDPNKDLKDKLDILNK